jgi:hypothetical protein
MFHSTVPHLALGQLVLTLLVTLTGMFKSLETPKPNQTKPNQNLLINRISFPNPDQIHPFHMKDCIVKEITYRKLGTEFVITSVEIYVMRSFFTNLRLLLGYDPSRGQKTE